MQVSLGLCLPRDVSSVPVTRHILACVLTHLGVSGEVCTDLEIAITEACDNVILHAQDGEEYEVTVLIEDELCAIEILDSGRGWDDTEVLGTLAPAGLEAECGRGLHLIQALTENVRLVNRPRKGAMVRFEKKLAWSQGAPIQQLLDPRS
jgi:serine/threonine-protein kinase RsbW